jgi:hypothetical protein
MDTSRVKYHLFVLAPKRYGSLQVLSGTTPVKPDQKGAMGPEI